MNRESGADLRRIFDASEQREFDAAKKILNGECGLVDACLFWRERAEERARRHATVDAVVAEVIEQTERRGMSDAYLSAQRCYLGRFARDFGGREIATIKGREITAWLSRLDMSARSVAVIATKIAGLFKRAVALDYVARAPLIDFTALPKVAPQCVEVFSVDEVRMLMEWISREYPEYVANFALRAFAGLRREEARRMRWEWIDCERGKIVVPAEICKTRDNWIMQSPILPDTVFAWIAVASAREREGAIPAPSRDFFEVITKKSGVAWKRNALRHTFCTAHISLCGSAEKTALLLRHRGVSTMYRHYLAALMPAEDAKKYFEILPKKA